MHPSSANVIDLYERHARQWDRDRGKVLIEKTWLDQFISRLPDGGTVLDVGCGSGDPMSAYLIGRGVHLTGLDSAPSMIAMCAERFPDHEWIVGDMRTLQLHRTFDGILAWDSFFHLTADDQRGMFPLFKAHSHPGSALLFTSGPQAGEAIGEYRREPLYHASLDPAEYEARLASNRFTVVTHVVDDADCGKHTVWLAKCEL